MSFYLIVLFPLNCDSFWAESVAGQMVARMNSKKSPAMSMMKDYQRQEFLARERVLQPELFTEACAPSSQHKRYMERFTSHPLYLDKTPRYTVKSTSRVPVTLSASASVELKIFVTDNDLGDALRRKVFFSDFTLNHIAIRTAESERTNKTRDSIVCGRYEIDDDEDEIFFGQVQYILKFCDTPGILLNVEWFQTDQDTDVTDDQRAGLDPVKFRQRTTLTNNWIHADNLVLQKHIIVGDIRARTFRVVVLI